MDLGELVGERKAVISVYVSGLTGKSYAGGKRIMYLANAYSILEEVVTIVIVPKNRHIRGKLIFVRINS